MQIVERIFGTYVPLCCLSIPVLFFFALAAALPVAYISLTSQEGRTRKEELGEKG